MEFFLVLQSEYTVKILKALLSSSSSVVLGTIDDDFTWKTQKRLLYIHNMTEILSFHMPLYFLNHEDTFSFQVSILVFILLHSPKAPGINKIRHKQWNVEKQEE